MEISSFESIVLVAEKGKGSESVGLPKEKTDREDHQIRSESRSILFLFSFLIPIKLHSVPWRKEKPARVEIYIQRRTKSKKSR